MVSGFYSYHAHFGRGPVVNPVPVAAQRRLALAHRSPLEPGRQHRRARLRQRVPDQPPRSIPDALWDELFVAMSCDRDRALMEFFVSSGARAAELLGVTLDDLDLANQRIWVISKGTRLRQPIPASPHAFICLARYFEQDGTPAAGEPIWRTRRGEAKSLTYTALRRILQRANQRLGTNWTLHDLRHTAAARMANGGTLTLAEVQAILRHADIRITGRYLASRVEELFDKLAEHYDRPRPQTTYSPGLRPRRHPGGVRCLEPTSPPRTATATTGTDQHVNELGFASRFVSGTVKATPAIAATPPRPFGDLAHATAGHITDLAATFGPGEQESRKQRGIATRDFLDYLAGFPGKTWQRRWDGTGFETEWIFETRRLVVIAVTHFVVRWSVTDVALLGRVVSPCARYRWRRASAGRRSKSSALAASAAWITSSCSHQPATTLTS